MAAGQISTKLMSDTFKITVFIVFTIVRQHFTNTAEIFPAIILGTCAPPITKETMFNRCCQTLWNLLNHFFWHDFLGKFHKQPVPFGLTNDLHSFPNGFFGRIYFENAHGQAMLKKDRENSLKPYKSPHTKIQEETSALKLEEEWGTSCPRDAYTPQFNSLCYYWITLRCHLK